MHSRAIEMSCPCGRRLMAQWMAFLLAIVSLGVTTSGNAADANPLFQSDEVLKAVLTAPIAQAYDQRDQEVRIYIPGQWAYVDDDGQAKRIEVSIRTRGNFRREYCSLPPLQLNFKKSQVKKTLFAGQDKLKLVAPCKSGVRFRQYVILEYLAYRTLEILTDYSFKTRLLRLTYVDSEEKLDPWTDIVFLIEDDSDVAKRLGLERIKIPRIEFDELDREKTALAELFQFLVANNDYSVLRAAEGEDCCHNVEVMVGEGPDGPRIPIPFDFDMSGLVNASYAAPPSHLPIRDVRFPYYTGLCHPPGVLEAAIAHANSKREEIFALFSNSEELNPKVKSKALMMVENFFNVINTPKRKRRELDDHCRGKKLLAEMLNPTKDST
ncbi:MAG: hypothetical protein OEM99_07275 [Gammaproteobacteria bacterium]|nr:hypothetical protein [Gammaproteobacteria bacterium]